MSFTWVVIVVVMIALLVFGLLLFLTNITGHASHEHHPPEETHGKGEEGAVDTSKIASEFLSAVWREKKARGEDDA
ncbi:MAG: hypothetical protein QXI19_12410 [Candidatus Caldarchaeum sp.]